MAIFQLRGKIAAAGDAVAFPAIERVLAGPAAKDHFGMVQEVAVDRYIDAFDG